MTTTGRINGLSSSLALKAPCKAATTASITRAGLQTIDGVALVAGDRCLVKDQATASQNGVFEVSTGAWTRDADFNSSDDITEGTRIWVSRGTVNGATEFVLTTEEPISLDTTSLVFEDVLQVQGIGLLDDPTFQNSVTIDKSSALATVGPQLKLRRLGVMSPNTVLSELLFQLQDSLGATVDGGGLDAYLLDKTAGSEDMLLRLRTIAAGALATRFNIGLGMYAEGLDDPGAGKLDVLDLLINGESLQRKAVWTPSIKFGGASVGVVGTQTGFYTRLGRVVVADFDIALTNKGSSVGDATIAGLPFEVSSGSANLARAYGGWSGLANVISVSPTYATTVIALKEGGATSDDNLANTHATNTTSIHGQVLYSTNDA